MNRFSVGLRSQLVATFAIVSCTFGCGGATQSSSSSGPGNTTPTTGSNTASASSTSSPSTQTAGASTTAKSSGSSSSQPAAPSPFHVVAEVDYEIVMQKLGSGAVLMAETNLLPIRDNTVAFDPQYTLTTEIRGDGVSGAFTGLLGVFPDAMFASVVRPSGRTGLTELYKWTGSKWASHYSTAETTLVTDAQPWLKGTVLILESHSITGEFHFTALPKGSKVFVPDPSDSKWKGVFGLCSAGILPWAIRTLPSKGEVFMPGTICATKEGDKDDGAIAVQHWPANSKTGKVYQLPEIGNKGFDFIELVVRDTTDVYIAGTTSPSRTMVSRDVSPYLAHFDGKTWTIDTVPFSDTIASLDIEPDGTLWAVSSVGQVFSRPAGGAWSSVAMPVGGADEVRISAIKVWARGAGDQWINGAYQAKDGSSRFVLLHSGPKVEMAKLPDFEKMLDTVQDLAMPTPVTPRCNSLFVLLYTLSKTAPADFDYPATREAVKGHRELDGARFIEFKRQDKRYMGAFVTDVDMGKKLVDIVKKKVPNSTPQLVCHAPKALRELEIQL